MTAAVLRQTIRTEGTLSRTVTSAAQRRGKLHRAEGRRTLRLKKSVTIRRALFYAPHGRLKRTGLVQFNNLASTTPRASCTSRNKSFRSGSVKICEVADGVERDLAASHSTRFKTQYPREQTPGSRRQKARMVSARHKKRAKRPSFIDPDH
ncbi:hypothetical protein BDR22DRAFT_889325 [Usnea florida]